MSIANHLNGIHAFVQTAECGSFSAAAVRMHLSRSAVAKSVARLEDRLGTRLFHRTTRSQSLTDDGQALYQRCVRVLAELEQAEDDLGHGRHDIAGRLRMTMPAHLRRGLGPILFRLALRHPGLRLELSFTDRLVDVVEEGYDLAVRSGPLPDSVHYHARFLGSEALILCAAPGYLAAHGTPRAVSDLAGHRGIFYGRADDTAALPAGCRIDDLESMLLATQSGLGISRLPAWLAAEALRDGSVVRVLPERQPEAIPLHALWPRTRHLSRKARLVIDELVAHMPSMLQAEG